MLGASGQVDGGIGKEGARGRGKRCGVLGVAWGIFLLVIIRKASCRYTGSAINNMLYHMNAGSGYRLKS
jgi:hypothetical protein